MSGIWYATREDVMSATDNKTSARMTADIDRDLESASRSVELLTHRVFYPWTGTRYFDYPGDQLSRAYRIWFGQFDLLSVTSITNGDASTVTVGNVFLNPQDGPPYTSVEVNLATTSAFAAGSTWQRAVAVTGLWGYSNDQTPAGTLAEDVDGTETGIDVSDSSLIGVGSLITVGSERMAVTGKSQLTTGTTLAGDLTASAANVAVTVASGVAVNVGERIRIDSETMQVVDKASNTLTVKRAVDGSVLAAHTTGATVYAPRTLTVVRGSAGTTAGTAANGAAITVWNPPGPIRELTVALALTAQQNRSNGYGTDNTNATSRLERQVVALYGRLRKAAV
jgi:hypothetical protein